MPTNVQHASFKFDLRALMLELHGLVHPMAQRIMQQNTNLTYKQCEIVAIDILISALTDVKNSSGILVEQEVLSTLDARNVKDYKQ